MLVGVAHERRETKRYARSRMVPIPDASGESLRSFLTENVEPSASVISDGWPSHPPATHGLYVHRPLMKGASGAEAST